MDKNLHFINDEILKIKSNEDKGYVESMKHTETILNS